MKKIDLKMRHLLSSIEGFQCPYCRGAFSFLEPYSLKCKSNHTFNMARPGYINLAPQLKLKHYDRTLFEARRRIFEAGFFEPLLNDLSTMVESTQGRQFLDAGCGEGSVLIQLYQKHTEKEKNALNWYGLDASKDGIYLAALNDEPIHWIVGDLANIPLRENTCDVILNVLSPANYASFRRVLKPEGWLIKVLPGPDHLKELRASMPETSKKQSEEQKVLGLFHHSFEIEEKKAVRYSIPVTSLEICDLIAMTPLMMHQEAEEVVNQLRRKNQDITVDVLVLKGQQRPEGAKLVT